MTPVSAPSSPAHDPELSGGELVLKPPPSVDPDEGGGLLVNAIPLLGSLGSIVLVATMGGTGHGPGVRQYLAGGMFLFATVGFIVVQIDRQRRQRRRGAQEPRADYLRYLGSVRERVRIAGDRQRRVLTRQHPEPHALPALAAERSRTWERGATHPLFLHVRYGVCHQPLSVDLVPPDDATTDQADPSAAAALQRLLAAHRFQPNLPATVDLRAFERIDICGDEERARSVARALICSATALHSPEHLVLAVLTTAPLLSRWDWVKWLPHASSARESDAIGPRRMVTTSPAELAALLSAGPAGPQVLVIVDGVTVAPAAHVLAQSGGATIVEIQARRDDSVGSRQVRLQLDDAGAGLIDEYGAPATVWRPGTAPVRARLDQCGPQLAEAFARRLTPLRPDTHGGPAGITVEELREPTDLLGLLGRGDARDFDAREWWRRRPVRERLRVPIGIGDDGTPIHLDLKESAQQGMGPHGLVVGATGSGKSELLRTLVLGLALTHAPEHLTMVLVDFKGGATFAGMASMPHVSALITNLADELTLVDRMQDALSGELVRRQELLRRAGNLSSVTDYERARESDPSLEPLPSLFVVVDEFSELLAAKPEFIDLFVSIGRLGRGLGVHLLLASQRLDEGRLRGLDSHLSYRIGLRTFSAHESRAALGVPDAHELPAVPGLGYLMFGPNRMQRFKAAYVSGSPPRGMPVRRPAGGSDGILPFTIAPVRGPALTEPSTEAMAPTSPDMERSVLDVAVSLMTRHGRPAHRIWLPPLDAPDTLDRLLPDLAVDSAVGLASPSARETGGLTVPLGTIDRPHEQRRDVLRVDLGGAGGHAAIVGGPRSGKSTLLRTLVASLALTTTPWESQIFVLDFGGGAFAAMSDLPHVAGIATRGEPDVVRRVVAEVRRIVDRREAFFRANGVDSIESYRVRRREGHVDDGYGDVFLVVDGWATLRSDFDDLEIALQQLAQRGLTFGLHLLTAASRWSDYRAALRDLLGTRLELRLGDPADSDIDRRTAALVPTDRPGRGLVPERLHFLGALPRIDGDGRPETLADGVVDLVRRVRAAWAGPRPPKLRLLPEQIRLGEIRASADVTAERPGARLLVGIDERELAPVSLDPATEPHLLVFGDRQSGKSALLRAYAHEVMRTRAAKQAQLVVVDYRRSLLGEVPEEYLLHHLTSTGQAAPALLELATYLEHRLPGPGVTPGQLRDRSWWTGAEVFVLVDDYDLVATQQGSPLHALHPLLAHARDVGLHVVAARRVGGASRALYEPVLQTLRDLGTPGLLLSGDPSEGQLVGNVRAVPAPPGRARLVTRDRGVETVQLAWVPPAHI